MYDPTVGRFYQRDPIWPAPGEANPFLYTNNSPTNATDPSGMTLFVPEGEAERWETASKGTVTAEPVRNGFAELVVSPAARNADTYTALAGLVPSNKVHEAMIALYDGDLAGARPNFDHAGYDRVLVPNLHILRERASPVTYQIPALLDPNRAHLLPRDTIHAYEVACERPPVALIVRPNQAVPPGGSYYDAHPYQPGFPTDERLRVVNMGKIPGQPDKILTAYERVRPVENPYYHKWGRDRLDIRELGQVDWRLKHWPPPPKYLYQQVGVEFVPVPSDGYFQHVDKAVQDWRVEKANADTGPVDRLFKWTLRQFGINEKGGANRRIWIVPVTDAKTYGAYFFHSHCAHIDHLHPFGESDHVIEANNLEDAYTQMQKKGLLGPHDRITFLEFAGHGSSGSIAGMVSAGDLKGQSKLPVTQRNRKAIILMEFGKYLAPNAEVRINACHVASLADGKLLMLEMQALMGGCRITANDGWIAGTGTGQWYTTTPEGTIDFDRRWGSCPWIGDAMMWLGAHSGLKMAPKPVPPHPPRMQK